jgi:regulator of sirC expression with transglutaminase-like and TPR domain
VLGEGYTRRRFLEGLGLAALALSGCGAHLRPVDTCLEVGLKGYVAKVREVRGRKHNYVLPSEGDVENKNLVHLLLDIEYEYSKNHSSQKERDAVVWMHERFDGICSAFGEIAGIENIARLVIGGHVLKKANPGLPVQDDFRIVVAEMLQNMFEIIVVAGKFSYAVPKVQYLSTSFTEKAITPSNLHTLMLGLAEVYRLPMVGVAMPTHIFARYKCPHTNINFDSGMLLTDQDYFNADHNKNARALSDVSLKSGAYFRDLSKKEVVGMTLATLAYSLMGQREFSAALDTAALAAKWSPRQPEVHQMYGKALMALDYGESAYREYEIARTLNPELEVPDAVNRMRTLVRENGIERCL